MKPVLLIIHCLFSLVLSAQVTEKTDTFSAEKSIEYYNSILKRNKNSAFANFGLASIYYMKKDYDATIKYCKKNIKEHNDYRADSYILYGLALDNKGKIEEATGVFKEAQTNYPENYSISYQLSFNFYKLRNYDDALNSIRTTIKLQPLYIPAHYLYGCLLFESKNDPGCISAFLFAMLLDNDTIRTMQSVAFVNQYLQRKVENISVPFFEARYKLRSLNDILNFYYNPEAKKEVFKNLKTEELVPSINYYINTSTQKAKEYEDFLNALIKEKQTEVFSHYVLRTLKNNYYLDTWFTVQKEKINEFATFLNNHLPEK